jgi:FkbM family methyltransferase
MRLSLDQWPEAQAFLLGRYDPRTVRYLLEKLPTNGVMIDGGAHVGLISLQIAVARRDVTIHAFEPHPIVAARFRENAQRNTASRIILSELGLSDTRGSLSFDLETHSVAGTDSISFVALDDYLAEHGIDRVNAWKLDVEGHELSALTGARQALEALRIDAIVLETIDAHGPLDPAHRLLMECGYQPVAMPDPRPHWLRRSRPITRWDNTAYEPVAS